MVVKSWKGGAPAVAQVDTLTVGGTAAAGQTYTVTIGVASVAYTSVAGDTNNSIAANLQALLAASTFGEFQDVTWTVSANVITATAVLAGQPFTITTSATGTGTLADATVTTNSGPNDVAIASNWDVGALPITGDTVYLQATGYDLLYNLQVLSGVTLAARYISSTFQPDSNGNATIGLPATNTNGASPYPEYRQQFWQCGVTADYLGGGSGNCSSLMQLDYGAVQTSCTVYNTGSASATNAAVVLKGTNGANVVSIIAGSVALAPLGDQAATVFTLNLGTVNGGAPTVVCGVSCSVTMCNQAGGTVEFGSAPTTLIQTSGVATIDAGNLTTLTAAGWVAYLGSGTITTLTVMGILEAWISRRRSIREPLPTRRFTRGQRCSIRRRPSPGRTRCYWRNAVSPMCPSISAAISH